MKAVVLVIFAGIFISCDAQRPSYAGTGPHGYPMVQPPADELGNRFGEDTTTMRLPIEALGDSALVKRLLKLPIDQQPFWLVNWQALEANRRNPQTYDQRENVFINKP